MLEHPDISKIQATGYVDVPNRPVVGYCAYCSKPIYKETDLYYGDEFVNDYGVMVHWDCWMDYGRQMKEMA